MNRVILSGRLTADPDVRYSQGENRTCIARYRLAVDRLVRRDGQREADFISCVAFGKAGEFVEKYLAKGMKIVIAGRIQTGSYTNRDGNKVYTTDVVVEQHEFCERKADNDRNRQERQDEPAQADADGFLNIPDAIEDDLPFH